MIYLDNAATGGFKPRAVIEAADNVMRYLSANPGRSGHRLSLTGAEIVFDCRKVLADFFGGSPEKVIFTKNCTEALNLAIFGTLRAGGKVITTAYEHNSVLRPLYYLQKKELISLEIIEDTAENLPQRIENAITPDVYLIVMTAASNVTGEKLPYEKVGAIAKSRGISFLLDGAQGAGHLPINLEGDGVNMLAVAGHKGLYGIMGSGALIIDGKTEVSPFIMGGTGTETFSANQPSCYPERLESGTLSLPAIASLKEGAIYAKENITRFSKQLAEITASVINRLKKIVGVKCYSLPNFSGIVSFSIKDMPSSEAADVLGRDFDVAVRGGFHCAPLMHKYLKTDSEGLVRASFSVQNTPNEINAFCRAVASIAENLN